MTNYEKITAMNKDDLAEFLQEIAQCYDGDNCRHCPLSDVEICCSLYGIKEWLSKEALDE